MDALLLSAALLTATPASGVTQPDDVYVCYEDRDVFHAEIPPQEITVTAPLPTGISSTRCSDGTRYIQL